MRNNNPKYTLRKVHHAIAMGLCSLQQRAESLLRIVRPPGDNYGANPREVALLQDKHDTTQKAVDTLAQAADAHAQRLHHTRDGRAPIRGGGVMGWMPRYRAPDVCA